MSTGESVSPRRYGLVAIGCVAAALALAAAASPARAEDDLPTYWNDTWSCGKAVTPDRKIVRALARDALVGYRGDTAVPPFLVASLPVTDYGVVVFVKRKTGWTMIPIEPRHALEKAFVSRRSGAVRLFTMFSVEGPGSAYTMLRTNDGFSAVSCSALDFPKQIKSPESALNLVDYNEGADGRGALVGSGEVEERSRLRTAWFRYRTSDGGATWSSPERLSGRPRAVPGVLEPVGTAAVRALHSDLVRSTR